MLIQTALLTLVLAGGWAEPVEVPLASPDTIPPEGTYADDDVRELVEAARRTHLQEREGIQSYEARVWQRVYGGLSSERFRRDRSLFQEERAGHVRWEEGGRRVVRWEGAFREVPVAGARSDRDRSMAESLAEDLAGAMSFDDPFFHDPGEDRIYLWGDEQWALHPLADTAHHHYRYRSGDTVTVTLPPDGRTIRVVEAVVEPRRSDFRLLAGSLWFDAETAELVRASYRAARPFNLGLDAETDVPRLLRNIEAEIRTVTVDYTLYDLEWWLPHRHAVSVEVRAGDLLRMPITLEWSAEGYRVNEPQSAELAPEAVPEGWTRETTLRPAPDARDEEGEPADSVEWVSIVPPPDSLHLSPTLQFHRRGARTGEAVEVFTPEELAELEDALDELVPRRAIFRPRLRYGVQDGLVRYNRVEGLSAAVAGEVPLTPLGRNLTGGAKFRLGVADLEPGGEVRVQRGSGGRRQSVAVYRRLEDTSDWDDFLNLSSSLSALVAGSDRGEYYRTHGAEVRAIREAPGVSLRGRLFAEAHRAAEKNTDFNVRGLVGSDRFRPNLEAEEGTWYGGSLRVRGHTRLQRAGLDLFGTIRGEAARGEGGSYRRVGGSGGAARPLGPVDAAVEAGVGRTWGTAPVQRHFFPGGPSTLRGVRPGSMVGESYWFGRVEAARGWPALRAGVFTDVGWAGPAAELGSGSPVTSVGVGVSFLDGIMRMDLAHRLTGDGAWRAHVYLDGLF